MKTSCAERRRAALILVLLLTLACGCRGTAHDYSRPAPEVLPHTTAAMRESGFWTARLSDPDRIILTPEEIRRFNAYTRDVSRLTRDVTSIAPSDPDIDARAALADRLSTLRAERLFLADGTLAGDGFYRRFDRTPAEAAAPPEPTYGIVTRFTDQRLLPTDEGLFAKPGDRAFDELQNSALDIGTPLAVSRVRPGDEWVYAQGPLTAGWVRAAAIASCSADDLRRRLPGSPGFPEGRGFVVVTAPAAEIYADATAESPLGRARMGAAFALGGKSSAALIGISVPTRNADGTAVWADGFVRRADVHDGFLPYTARTVIEQAFRLRGVPYGWGDRGGTPDCSRFIQQVFATVGIEMPRNSKEQANVGVPVGADDPWEEGVTLLAFAGHSMLYLGTVDGRPYTIHALYGYREPAFRGECVRVVNRVVVSDLSLGECSSKGSLRERITAVRKVALP